MGSFDMLRRVAATARAQAPQAQGGRASAARTRAGSHPAPAPPPTPPPPPPPSAPAATAPPPLRRYEPGFDPTLLAQDIARRLAPSRTIVADALIPTRLGRSATVKVRRRDATVADLATILIQSDGEIVVHGGELPEEVRAVLAELAPARFHAAPTAPAALPPPAAGPAASPRKGGVDAHWIGTCRVCHTPLRVTTRALDTKDATKGWEIVGGPLATKNVPWRGHDTIAVTCPTCRAQGLALERIHGEKTHAPCNAACMYARGPLCECSCGGENHSIGFAGELLFPAGSGA